MARMRPGDDGSGWAGTEPAVLAEGWPWDGPQAAATIRGDETATKI